eukprot:s3455_g1.t1
MITTNGALPIIAQPHRAPQGTAGHPAPLSVRSDKMERERFQPGNEKLLPVCLGCPTQKKIVGSCSVTGRFHGEMHAMVCHAILMKEPLSQVRKITAQISALKDDWQMSLELLRSIPGPLDVVALTATMNVCVKASSWAWALHLFQSSQQRDTVVYNAAIHACARGDVWQVAAEILQTLQETLRADVVSFSSAMAAMGGAHHWEQAWHLLNLMDTTQVQRNSVAYLNGITACAKVDQWQRALQGAMDPAGLSEAAACNVALAAIPAWQDAISLFSLMQIRRTIPSSITVRAAIGSCEKGKQWQPALLLCQVQSDEKVYSAAISACQTGSAVSQGLALLKDMPPGLSDSVVLWSLARLAEDSPEHVALSASALRHVTGDLQKRLLTPQHLAMLAWATRTLSIASPKFLQLLCKQTVSQLERFNLEELRHMIWGLAGCNGCDASLDVTGTILAVQREVRRRVLSLDLRKLAKAKRKATEDDLLTVLWAGSFSGLLSTALRRAVQKALHQLAVSLERPVIPQQKPTGPGAKILRDLEDSSWGQQHTVSFIPDEDEDENEDEKEDEDEDESEDGVHFDHEDENDITLLKIRGAFEAFEA